MFAQDVLAQNIVDDIAPVYSHGVDGIFDIVQDGKIVASGLSFAKARATRAFYRDYFGGAFDIIESAAYGVDGNIIEPQKFSHIPSHVPHDVPLFDIHIDGALVAQDMTADAGQAFINASVDILDIFSAIAEAIISPEFSFDDIMHTIDTMSRAEFYGVTTVRYAPVENDAPPPARSETDWRVTAAKEKSRLRVAKITKSRELSFVGTPEAYKEYSIIDVATFEVLYSGTKKSCIAYMGERVSLRGEKLYNMRVVRYNDTAYRMNVDINGYELRKAGHIVCRGTRQEVYDYVKAGIAAGTVSPVTHKVGRVM